MHSALRRLVLLLTGAAALGVLAPSAGAAPPARSRVRGTVPSWARASRDRGDADGTRRVTVRVVLGLRDQAGADALLHQVSDPTSAAYGRYLTPAQFNRRFAPAVADVRAVKAFLRGAGLEIEGVPANRHNVEASGTLAQAERAFQTDVRSYAYRGRRLDAPATELTVPVALASSVSAVTGLDEAGTLTRPLNDGPPASGRTAAPNAPTRSPARHAAGTSAPPPEAFVNAPPCSTYFGEKLAIDLPRYRGRTLPYAPCGYTPAQFRGGYGLAGLNARGIDGAGVTVAITDAYAAPTILTDARRYSRIHGEPPLRGNQYRQLLPRKPFRYGYDDVRNGDLCGEQGWYGEETLDVEAVHGIAPGADILYVASRSCDDGDFIAALNRIVNGRKADVISNSWGGVSEDEPADLKLAYDQTFLQAALEGIGVYFSSGDNGDESLTGDGTGTPTGVTTPDFPATEPLVTAAGGTSLAVDRNDGYGGEVGWATGTASLTDDATAWTDPVYLYGGGGGTSALFGQPFYQRGHVPPAIARGQRTIPDVSMDGDPQTGMLVGETQTFTDGTVAYGEYRIGGTSLSSPLLAATQALADQAQGYAHGFANPAIYALDGTAGVHDIAASVLPPGVVRRNYEDSADPTSAIGPPVLRTLDDEFESLHQAPGWDNLTGVGTPNGAAYVRGLGRTR